MIHKKWPRALFTALFGLAALLFFALGYPHHLHYQEQYQLFLFDGSYVADVLSWPGGVADLIGRFLTQFCLYAWAGAALVALLLAGSQWLTARLLASTPMLLGLSLVPATLLWMFFCDQNALLGTLVAFLIAQLAAWAVGCIPNGLVRCLFTLILVPLIYRAIGPMSILYVWLSGIEEARRSGKIAPYKLIFAAIILVAALLNPLVAQFHTPVPLEALYFGPHYFRYPMIVPQMLWYAVAAMMLITLLGVLVHRQTLPTDISEVRSGKTLRSMTLSMLLVGAACAWCIHQVYDPATESVMGYDFMARHRQWNRLISTANQQPPSNPVSCTALNLALSQKDRLADHMFEYNQNSLEGLLPAFERDPFSPLVTAEAYYHLGMINTAQRLVFEAQEANPDFQKSARCYRRLAETNLINGNYAVARKYLEPLCHTLFYRSWAQETLALLRDEKALAAHPEYGLLRKRSCQDDYFFSERELPQMLGRLYMADRTNRMAYEYLQAAYLLTGSLEEFTQCIELGRNLGYAEIPKHYQEALMLWWSHSHGPDEPMPYPLRPEMKTGLQQYYALQSQGKNPQLQQTFGRTYWHYFFTMLKQ